MSEQLDFALVFAFLAAGIAWVSFMRHNAHGHRRSHPYSSTEGPSGRIPE